MRHFPKVIAYLLLGCMSLLIGCRHGEPNLHSPRPNQMVSGFEHPSGTNRQNAPWFIGAPTNYAPLLGRWESISVWGTDTLLGLPQLQANQPRTTGCALSLVALGEHIGLIELHVMIEGTANWIPAYEMQYLQLFGDRIELGCHTCVRVFRYQMTDSDTLRLDYSDRFDKTCFHAVLKRVVGVKPLLLSPGNIIHRREWEELEKLEP